MDAAEQGNPEVVRLLIEKGADVNVNLDFMTPLKLAKNHNHLEVARILKEAGAKE